MLCFLLFSLADLLWKSISATCVKTTRERWITLLVHQLMKTHMIIYSLYSIILTVVSHTNLIKYHLVHWALHSSASSFYFLDQHFWLLFILWRDMLFGWPRKKGLIFSDYINFEANRGKKIKRINSLSVWNNKYHFPLLQRDKVNDCATPKQRNHFFTSSIKTFSFLLPQSFILLVVFSGRL